MPLQMMPLSGLFVMFCCIADSRGIHDPTEINGPVALSNRALPSSNNLSNGSTFILLSSLLLALLFHPFSGSLIYGPSLRLWIAAPTAITLEIGIILLHILKYFLLKWTLTFPNGRQSRSDTLSFRNETFCLVAARMTNTFDGDRRRKLHGHDSKVLKMIKSSVKNIDEGWRVRLAVVVPIIFQYIKIMAVSGPGTAFLRILGTLYIIHWIILEALLLAAKMGEESATVSRVKELMLPQEYINDDLTAGYRETPEFTLIYEPLSYIIHQIGFVICSFIMIYCWSGRVLPLLIVVIMPWAWLVRTGMRFAQRARKFATAVGDRVDWKEAMVLLTFGGPDIGPDIGCIFFVFWILYCTCIYDSSFTSRPQWPWLDWLG